MQEPVGLAGLLLAGAPMHRQKHRAGPDSIGDLYLGRHRPAARAHLAEGAIDQAMACCVGGIDFQ